MVGFSIPSSHPNLKTEKGERSKEGEGEEEDEEEEEEKEEEKEGKEDSESRQPVRRPQSTLWLIAASYICTSLPFM